MSSAQRHDGDTLATGHCGERFDPLCHHSQGGVMSETLMYSSISFVVVSVIGGYCLASHDHRVLRFPEILSLRQ